jgi:sortase A
MRVLERLLVAIAFVSLGWYGYSQIEAHLYQSIENRALDALLVKTTVEQNAAPAVRRAPVSGSVIGRVEIPRLGVSTVIRAGADSRTLQLAVGHIPGTALPGEDGNVGLAAHRDTFFRRLKDIEPDDEIRIVTPEDSSVYRVERTNVVQPEDVWVLDPTSTPVLTLITCYPFNYIGSAPERFVVRATLDKRSVHGRSSAPDIVAAGSIMPASNPRR